MQCPVNQINHSKKTPPPQRERGQQRHTNKTSVCAKQPTPKRDWSHGIDLSTLLSSQTSDANLGATLTAPWGNFRNFTPAKTPCQIGAVSPSSAGDPRTAGARRTLPERVVMTKSVGSRRTTRDDLGARCRPRGRIRGCRAAAGRRRRRGGKP